MARGNPLPAPQRVLKTMRTRQVVTLATLVLTLALLMVGCGRMQPSTSAATSEDAAEAVASADVKAGGGD